MGSSPIASTGRQTDGMSEPIDLVTGAFGNTGSEIAARLLASGRGVRTLTDHPGANADIDSRPHAFGDADRLRDAFTGVSTFYNTYWMRTGDQHGAYDTVVARSEELIAAAEAAGVERIVHLSVVKPSATSPYAYFRGKAAVEDRLARSPIPAAVIRPALIFGGEAALVQTLAYILRRAPVFAVAGDGQYRVRPVHVDDVADLCVAAGQHRERETVDAIGPERPTFLELVTSVRDAMGRRTRLVKLPPQVVLTAGRVLGAVLREQLLTRDELLSTIDGYADADGPATGERLLSTWLRENADQLGRHRG